MAGEIREFRWIARQSDFTGQTLVDLYPAVVPDQQWARRGCFQKRCSRPRAAEDGLGKAKPPRRRKRDSAGDADPQQGQADDRNRGARQGAHEPRSLLPMPAFIRSRRDQKKGREAKDFPPPFWLV